MISVNDRSRAAWLRAERQERNQAAIRLAEQRLMNGLVKSPPDLPPPSGFEVNDLDYALLEKLWDDWVALADRLLDSLAKTEGLTVDNADHCLTIQMHFRDLRLRPVPLVRVQVTSILSAIAQVAVDGASWTLRTKTDRGEPCYRRYKTQRALGYLTQTVVVKRSLGELALPIAVLEALSSPEREAPGAKLVAIGVNGATWDAGGQESTLPAFVVSALKDLPIGEQLNLLQTPPDIRPLALRLLDQGQVSVSGNVEHGMTVVALPASEDPDQDLIEALKGLGFNAKLAQDLEQLARTQFTIDMSLDQKTAISLRIRDQQL